MAVTDYRFIPKQGFHPLLLGMTGEQVERALDEVPKVAKSRLLSSEEDWFFPGSYTRVSMRDGRLVEASVTPPARLWFHGRSLFEAENLWRELVVMDGHAEVFLGFLVLRKLSMTLTGFHDGDTAQLAATVFEAGRWDQFAQEGKAFKL